eukprot:TRINITY_DN2554_c0_g1_i1.p1 TRINITY_DN2554_c0_g1~~TRINITY_DN2554_c0_g1_i1.p1  ORF type:complete len:172 (+),score=20.81 TRINITY_DN2554_c0_g1_i1:103-618(+)
MRRSNSTENKSNSVSSENKRNTPMLRSQPKEIRHPNFNNGFEDDTKKIVFHGGSLGFIHQDNLITQVVPDSQSINAGVHVGWKILEVNGVAQPNLSAIISQALDKTNKNDKPTEVLFDQNNIVVVFLHGISDLVLGLRETLFSQFIQKTSREIWYQDWVEDTNNQWGCSTR